MMTRIIIHVNLIQFVRIIYFVIVENVMSIQKINLPYRLL